MRFTKISDSAYDNFSKTVDRMALTQIPAYIRARRNLGSNLVTVGVVDDSRILAAATVLLTPWKKFFLQATVNFGPTFAPDLGESHNDVEKFFYTELVAFLKKNPKIIRARLVPYTFAATYTDIERGEETPQAANTLAVLNEIGAVKVDRNFYEDPSIQTRHAYVKNIEGMTLKDVTKTSNSLVRRGFNKLGKNGVEVRFLEPSNYQPLYDVLNATSERTGIPPVEPATAAYYEEFARELGPENVFAPIAVLDTASNLEEIANTRKEATKRAEKINKQRKKLEAEGKELSKGQANQLRDIESQLEALDRREENTREIQAEHGDELVLAGALYIRTPHELVYLVAGAYAEYGDYYGNYLIHRVMFEWATENNIDIYNFWGISGQYTDDAPDAGVLAFKRHFNGEVEEFLGTFDLALRPVLDKATSII